MRTAEPSTDPASPWKRWWRYQNERFPLAQHAPLVAAFSYSAVCFSRLARTDDGPFAMPGPFIGAVAFACCLGFFLQLRIADEHKDYEEDARFRPYRAVPRGLVSLAGLRRAGLGVAIVQAGAAWLLDPRLLVLLALTWIYCGLMSMEFFAGDWLLRRPLLYMLSHLVVMPLIDLFATGCDWVVAAATPPAGALALFLAASYFNGMVIEVGRKIRAPADEEEGVTTYSAAWGRGRAVAAWLGAMTLAAGFATAAAASIGALPVVLVPLAALLIPSSAAGFLFLRRTAPASGRRFEMMSGLWVIALYLSLGIVPAILRSLA